MPPACWSTFWKSTFKQQLGCRFDIMDSKSLFLFCILHMQYYMSCYIISFFDFIFTSWILRAEWRASHPTRAWWRVQPRLLTQKRGQFLHYNMALGWRTSLPYHWKLIVNMTVQYGSVWKVSRAVHMKTMQTHPCFVMFCGCQLPIDFTDILPA